MPAEPGSPTEFKPGFFAQVDAEELLALPDALRRAGFTTIAELTEKLLDAITSMDGGYHGENSIVYEAVLRISSDGGRTWIPATRDNFPSEGISIILPYPEGLDYRNYDFTVAHMFTVSMNGHQPGDVETFSGSDIELTEDGIRVTVTSLSPVAISWQEKAPQPAADSSAGTNRPASNLGTIIVLWLIFAVLCALLLELKKRGKAAR